MIEVYCSTHARLRFLYMVSALWLKPFESSALRERTTTKTELTLGLFFIAAETIYCPIYFGYLENFIYICDT